MIKEERFGNTFFCVYGWMLKLNLKHTDLFVFAVIHGYTRNCGCYTGSQQYLAKLTGCSERSIYESLSRLSKRGLIRIGHDRGRSIVSLAEEPRPSGRPQQEAEEPGSAYYWSGD